jgi:hypothetical protein
MSYTPNNVSVYLYAFAGSLAGIAVGGKYVTDPTQADYTVASQQADALAQAVDTEWGSGTFTSVDLLQIQSACAAVWGSGRSPQPSSNVSASNYTTLANAIVAAVHEGTAQVVSEGISPGVSSGNGQIHTFNSVNAGPTGTANVTTYDAGVFTPKTTGTVSVWGYMSVAGQGGGVADGDEIDFQLRVGGAVDTTSIVQSQQLGPTAFKCSASLHNIYACTAGVPMTFGIQATDTTNGSHTINSPAGGVCVFAQENQTFTA